MNNIVHVSNVLNRIKALGVLITLDDFGTGYFSLILLRELPIDILKIDKSFVRTLDKNIDDLTITQTMIGLGNNLGLVIIAEGVESEQQGHLQQGYYFSRPVPYESFLQLINESNEVSPTSIRRLCNAAGLH